MWILKQMKTVSVTSGVARTVEPDYASRLTVSPLSGHNNGTLATFPEMVCFYEGIRIMRGSSGWIRKRIN
jgi:hypothetical protein